jgi:uncharacterized protein (TIGR00299 family) protein
MKTLFFDCFAGASGDMILGAMIDAGVDPAALMNQLECLNVSGFKIDFKRVERSGISSTHAVVHAAHEHQHRHLSDIKKIIDKSNLSSEVKSRAIQIFTRLAEAEARVHNQHIDQVHFHEVGALDAIVDVVGASICFEMLGIQRFVSSPINVGTGFVEMEHGRFPVPPPAVVELLKGVPFYSTEVQGELLTPTGAAIITTVCESYGMLPEITVELSGYGAGTRQYEKFPNVLRIFVGDTGPQSTERRAESLTAGSGKLEPALMLLETNLDDLSPQILGHLMERAFELGALDCYFTAVQMKKDRPGTLVSILCEIRHCESLTDLLFKETTTLGVRSYEVKRRTLQRETVRVETQYGPIDVKVAYLNGSVVNEMPEFEQCRRAASETGLPLKVIQDEVRLARQRQKP